MDTRSASLTTATEWLLTCGSAAAVLFVVLLMVVSAARLLRRSFDSARPR